MAINPATSSAPIGQRPKTQADPLRFFFFADTHAGFKLTDAFIKEANKQKPDLLVDGGDIVEEGTEPEYKKAYADRAKLESPLAMVTGNHDVLRRGPFSAPPPQLPEFQSFDRKGVHFILLDNNTETLSEDQFLRLKLDLEANKAKATIVAMHVPPFVDQEFGVVRFRKLIPFNSANPAMKDKDQVERFKGLMKEYGVSAVLSGHTHAGSACERDGTKYITVGAVGGKTPGPGIQHEYLDLTVRGRDVQFKRVPLDNPSKNPLAYVFGVGNYIARKNSFNHAALGWDEYIPNTSAEARIGVRSQTTRRGESTATVLQGEIEVNTDPQGKNAWFGEGSIGIGSKDLSVDAGAGYKRRFGSYNRGAYVSGAATANAGFVVDRPTAGVGVKLGVGYEVKNWTFGISHERATNRQATTATVGWRF